MDKSRRRYAPLAGLLLVGAAAVSTTTFAQTMPGDVAANFAKAVVAHDWGAAAAHVTNTSRADFLSLMELGDRVTKARGDLQSAMDQKFKREPARGFHAGAPADAVLSAEVAAQREISPTVVELDMRLSTTRPIDPAPIVTWRAVQAGGVWKIELPACANPQAATPLKQHLEAALAIHIKLAGSISRGEFASAADVRTALANAQRAAMPSHPQARQP
ncbi:MAG TPA: hypothetical protein VH249_24525 [Xanthobacteraceae bacterium]|jgi:hypothetical protein|nr:hypothetical protein [Xanthobacteraceae bacterium]